MKHPLIEEVFYDTVTVGERGQVVIPARARKELEIKPGDKLIVLRAMGKAGVVLVHAKHLETIFNRLTKHVGEIKKLISKGG